MALSRWDPFRDLMSIQSEMNRLFGRTYGGEPGTPTGAWIPALDIYETDANEVVLKAELPDMKREDISVTFENGVLTLKGERGSQALETEAFVEALRGRVGVPVETEDERFTTRLAQQTGGKTPEDALAAAHLLQGFLERTA